MERKNKKKKELEVSGGVRGVTLKLLTLSPSPPPFPNENERLYSPTWDSNCVLRGSLWGIESFFRPFEPRPEERGKESIFRKKPQRRPYTIINFPSSQNFHSLRAFSQFWQQGEYSRWIDDLVRVREETVESR